MVADEFGLDYDTLVGLYTITGSSDTNHSVRDMWKYATAQGISGTPTAFVNGVKLDSTPRTTKAWLNVLNSVYDSQYKPAGVMQ